jgi:hypothetical protein
MVWQIDGALSPRDFLPAIRPLLTLGDIAMFGMYEPTEALPRALTELGATQHAHIEGFSMCFDINRDVHPKGCAFQYVIKDTPFDDILQLEDSILAQTDIGSFYDHFLVFRPGTPRLPLMTFHDAACGGSLYLSGHYSEAEIRPVAEKLSRKAHRVDNPILARLYPDLRGDG